ncbi:hypothetical protein Acr_22g0008720 [Actinidia rufa]|uniref:Uncharacterized protein n=1 Tax=Actinidia rufa TaxID=165716 RepID=A0A7J0GL93_9ERIC|nr:hypothetical protein Acr_22g0008720 [Actinidia rufa]
MDLTLVVVKIWASNQQSILLGFLGTGPRTIKGRPAQTNRNKGPGRGRSKPLRRGDQTKAMTANGVMGRVRGSRRDPRKDEILVEMESLEMGILSTLPRPRARRRQYFNSDQLMSILMVALASSVEMTWRGSMDSFYLGQEGSEMELHRIDVWRCPLSPLGRGHREVVPSIGERGFRLEIWNAIDDPIMGNYRTAPICVAV